VHGFWRVGVTFDVRFFRRGIDRLIRSRIRLGARIGGRGGFSAPNARSTHDPSCAALLLGSSLLAFFAICDARWRM
jgi:hypothetical protein